MRYIDVSGIFSKHDSKKNLNTESSFNSLVI